jgi:hypothetical protein
VRRSIGVAVVVGISMLAVAAPLFILAVSDQSSMRASDPGYGTLRGSLWFVGGPHDTRTPAAGSIMALEPMT